MTTLHGINGARVENRRIFVGETHPISERAPITEAAPPAGCALSGKIGGSFAPGRKNSVKNPSDKFAFEKGTFVCFAQRSVVNLSDCQFTTNPPLRQFCYVNKSFLTPALFFLRLHHLCYRIENSNFERWSLREKEFEIPNSKLDLCVIRQVIR